LVEGSIAFIFQWSLVVIMNAKQSRSTCSRRSIGREYRMRLNEKFLCLGDDISLLSRSVMVNRAKNPNLKLSGWSFQLHCEHWLSHRKNKIKKSINLSYDGCENKWKISTCSKDKLLQPKFFSNSIIWDTIFLLLHRYIYLYMYQYIDIDIYIYIDTYICIDLIVILRIIKILSIIIMIHSNNEPRNIANSNYYYCLFLFF
jgi:hypothetical protein